MRMPTPDYRLRLLMLIWFSITFFWMSVEDNSAVTVIFLGSGAAILLILGWLGQQYGGQIFSERGGLIIAGMSGAAAGAGAILITTALMFFKTAWHAHLFPDYPFEMMLDMLARLPVWGIAGMFIGVALGLLWNTQHR